MSQQPDFSAKGEQPPLDLLQRWYHVPVFLGVVAFMLWKRLQSYGTLVRNGQVYFRGNDPWYHLHETSYLLENYRNTMPYDIFTGFPFENKVGQFSTLWDHIMVVSTWLAGPIMGGTEEVMLIWAPIAGALVALPTYFIVKRFADRFAAVAGAVT